MESILVTIREMLGLGDETHFDVTIVAHINTMLNRLTRLGVGPKDGFFIEDDTTTWSDYIPEMSKAKMHDVKTYLYLQVKLLFDPPTNSAVLKAHQDEIKELEWRLNDAAEFT